MLSYSLASKVKSIFCMGLFVWAFKNKGVKSVKHAISRNKLVITK